MHLDAFFLSCQIVRTTHIDKEKRPPQTNEEGVFVLFSLYVYFSFSYFSAVFLAFSAAFSAFCLAFPAFS